MNRLPSISSHQDVVEILLFMVGGFPCDGLSLQASFRAATPNSRTAPFLRERIVADCARLSRETGC